MTAGTWSLRGRLRAGDSLVGALVRPDSDELVEMMAVAGFDFVLLDCEHGGSDISLLRRHVTAAEALGMPAMVRAGERDPAFVLRALDLGVQGIVAPHVASGADAEAAVRATRYPPDGDRGFARYSRAGRYGSLSVDEHRQRAEECLVIAMLESPAGVGAAGEIVDTPGIDAYVVGPSDLGASRTPDDPPLQELIARAHDATRGHDTWRADLTGTADDARHAIADGSRLVIYNLTLSIMDLLRTLRPVT